MVAVVLSEAEAWVVGERAAQAVQTCARGESGV